MVPITSQKLPVSPSSVCLNASRKNELSNNGPLIVAVSLIGEKLNSEGLKKVLGSLFVKFVLPLSVCPLSGFPGFRPQSKNKHVRSIGISALRNKLVQKMNETFRNAVHV